MELSQDCTEVVAAFIKAQSSLKVAAKDTKNPFFKSTYADLNSVWSACQAALAENGLASIQDVVTIDNGVNVTTRILHTSGQWIQCGPLTVPLGGKADAQAVGSAITYGRRYGLSATLGIVADEDDDGNAAAKNAPEKNKPIQDNAEEDPRRMSKGDAREPYAKMLEELKQIQSSVELEAWGNAKRAQLNTLPEDWQKQLRQEYADHKHSLEQRAVA